MEIFGMDVSLFDAVVLTVVVLFASTVYTFRNILRIWRKGQINQVSEVDTKIQEEDDDASSAAQADALSENPISKTGPVNLEDIDPVEYCEHIQSEVKKAKQRVTTKKIVEELTAEQVQEERDIQHQQLQNIFRLMQTQSDKFGVNSIDEIQQQMKLYG